MKHLKKILFAFTFFALATNFTIAQSKVAHINTGDLIQAMPSMKIAQAEIEKLAKSLDADVQSMAKEFETTRQLYANEAEGKTDEENGKRADELAEKQQNIRQYQAQAQKQLQEKNAELLKPITEKALAAIKKVARAQGYEFVLDSSQGGGVILADGKNLLDDVKKELGI